ncbi:MAG: hypothetical protein KAU06_08420 [Candidatus Marinimicrobia bacterium]|nr:hypothetical protein [Candidatus Neomarinimicrobiota bacterium]
MKRLFVVIMVLLISGLIVNAQEKFDEAEKELDAITDSVAIEEDSNEKIMDNDKESTKIEVNRDWDDWDEDWDEWREKRKEDWKSSKKRGYFRGGAGGWDYYMMELNVDAINNKLAEIGLSSFDKNIFMSGGGGWGYIGRGIRIGGLGAHGQVKSAGNPGSIDIAKEVTLSINFGGFMIEKVFHPFNKTELYFGTMIGGGNAQLKFEQWSGPVVWDELWGGYNNTVIDTSSMSFTDYQNELSCGYITALPTIGFRYNIFRWAAVGVNVGYLYSKMNQDGWKMDGKTVSGVPDIDFSNVIYRFNIYFGG